MTGTLIRKQLRNKENKNNTEQELLSLLFASDRLTQEEEIMKAKGSLTDMLVSDRSYYSSIAYQDVGGINDDWIYSINRHAPQPDLLIILDLDEETAVSRCSGGECFEDTTCLRKARGKYLELGGLGNAVVVDAWGSMERVLGVIVELVYKVLL